MHGKDMYEADIWTDTPVCPCAVSLRVFKILLLAWDICYLHARVSPARVSLVILTSTADLALQVGRPRLTTIWGIYCLLCFQYAQSLSSVAAWDNGVSRFGHTPQCGLDCSISDTFRRWPLSPTLRGTMCARSSSAEGKSYNFSTAACTRKQ